jgi:hypothetical protein
MRTPFSVASPVTHRDKLISEVDNIQFQEAVEHSHGNRFCAVSYLKKRKLDQIESKFSDCGLVKIFGQTAVLYY